MARLGDLERSVMDVLWDTDGWLTAREVASRLHHERDLAYTTVLTVLERLERKGFVQRQRAARAHLYAAADSRESVVAEAMLEALGTADDRGSALVRFVGAVSTEEAEILRRALTAPADDAVRAQEASSNADLGAGIESDPGNRGQANTRALGEHGARPDTQPAIDEGPAEG